MHENEEHKWAAQMFRDVQVMSSQHRLDFIAHHQRWHHQYPMEGVACAMCCIAEQVEGEAGEDK